MYNCIYTQLSFCQKALSACLCWALPQILIRLGFDSQSSISGLYPCPQLHMKRTGPGHCLTLQSSQGSNISNHNRTRARIWTQACLRPQPALSVAALDPSYALWVSSLTTVSHTFVLLFVECLVLTLFSVGWRASLRSCFLKIMWVVYFLSLSGVSLSYAFT